MAHFWVNGVLLAKQQHKNPNVCCVVRAQVRGVKNTCFPEIGNAGENEQTEWMICYGLKHSTVTGEHRNKELIHCLDNICTPHFMEYSSRKYCNPITPTFLIGLLTTVLVL